MTVMSTPTEPRVGVVERVTQILDAFAEATGPLLLEEVTRLTRLPRSTAFRILGQLMDQGWVTHGPRGYALGGRLDALQTRSKDQEEVRAVANDHLNTLHLRAGAVAHLSVLEGGFIHYLDKVGGHVAATVPSRVGARLIATDTVSGRALLATCSPEVVDQLISGARGRPLSPGEHRAVHVELAQIRARQGVAVEHAQGVDGVTSIGAPVRHRGRTVAAVSLAWRGPLTNSSSVPLLLMTATMIQRGLTIR